MKNLILLLATIIAFARCSDTVEATNVEDQSKDLGEIKEFVLPDTLDVKRELVIAAYYEMHPREACVIFAFKDSTRTTAYKYSYSSDSSFVVQELISHFYNQYKVKKDTGESYIIKPTSVVWMDQHGNTAGSAEFERIDVEK